MGSFKQVFLVGLLILTIFAICYTFSRYTCYDSSKSLFTQGFYRGQKTSFEYVYDEMERKTVLSGILVSYEPSSNNPTITLSTSPTNYCLPVGRKKVKLSFSGIKTLFLLLEKEDQTTFRWRALAAEKLRNILKRGVLVTVQFADGQEKTVVDAKLGAASHVIIHKYKESEQK